jgi:hypothetical protein
MKRLWLLLLLTLSPGCAGFEDYTYTYEDADQAAVAPSSCGCQTPTTGTVSAASGLVPTVTPLPAIQTREPDLAPTRR